MTKQIWLAANHQLGNIEIIDKNRRPFKDLTEMHIELINRHNSVVGYEDTVYFLGNLLCAKWAFNLLNKFHGHRRLIKGSWESKFANSRFTRRFAKVDAIKYLPEQKVILSHLPVHASCITEGWINIHSDVKIDDPRYINVNVENIDYTPVNLSKLLKNANK